MERRFIKALAEFFPGRSFRLYTDEASLYRALEKAGHASAKFAAVNLAVANPAGTVPLWRPFLWEQGSGNGIQGRYSQSVDDNNLSCFPTSFPSPHSLVPIPLFIPVLPWPLGPEVLVLGKDMEDSFPPGDLIPPVLLAPAARALHDLAAALKTFAPDRGLPRYPKIDKALGKTPPDVSGADVRRNQWRRLGHSPGIYLTTETGGEEYTMLFKKFLENGFLIPPSRAEPAILPLSMSPGEESKLAQLLNN